MATSSIGPIRTVKLIAKRMSLPLSGASKSKRFGPQGAETHVRRLNEPFFEGVLLSEVLNQNKLNLLMVHNLGAGGGADKFILSVVHAIGKSPDVNVLIVGENVHASLRYGSPLRSSNSTLDESETVDFISKLMALENTAIIFGNVSQTFLSKAIRGIEGYLQSRRCGIVSFCEDRDFFGVDRSSGITALKAFMRAGIAPSFMVSDNLRRLEFLEEKFDLHSPKFIFAIPARVEVQNFKPSATGPIAVVGRNVKQKQIVFAVKSALAASSRVVVVTDELATKNPRVRILTGGTMEDALKLRPSMLLHASLYDGTANTLVEAAHHGLPIIAFSGSTSDEISSAYSGFTFFHSHKISAAVDAVNEAISNYPERLRLAQQSRKFVRKSFSEENLQNQVDQFLRFLKAGEI